MDNDVRTRLMRLSAFPTMVTALLFFGFGVMPSLLLPTAAPLLEWVQDPQWFVLNFAALLMALLLPLSLVALYAAQAEALGKVGLAGFVFAFWAFSSTSRLCGRSLRRRHRLSSPSRARCSLMSDS
jgi:predicted lysophospholipase L1 biosynthesis ABC-type transport system permease subunit